ncbi:ImmA/IrrE family metallo-endopeptidase [Chryseobacterium lathyri]|jgi:Zn-dependent peptidase ImmA (M78 family)|uniref:IrrE N-terminal-like domain-containing protein n=1 Tax=Chryseobacterium lathyri TaxID=395933 RepID=A0A511YER4_9FLAO|nr:ImmA/IrrE family metallo-endopeptidase [Chryseobacterium lathyri]GEN73688.1 hypothetical protein CLA01_37600 [Chryseobacterium lathyri]
MDDLTRRDIEKISYNILKDSKSFDTFPTPVDQILHYSDFALDKSIDLRNVDQSFFGKLKEKSQKSLLTAISKVMGIFDRHEKTIYIDSNINKNLGRKNFVKLHEIGHGILPWQNDIMLALDDDETLNEEIEKQFEAEANYFASITLFQHDRFVAEIEKASLGLGTVMQLSKKFGSSVHSTLRNYVLKSGNKCVLLVLNNISKSEKNNIYTNKLSKRDIFYSSRFLKELGTLNLPEEFGFKWNFIQDFMFDKRYNENGEIDLITAEGEEIECEYHFFNSTYNSFVLIFPKGEKNKAKIKYILS